MRHNNRDLKGRFAKAGYTYFDNGIVMITDTRNPHFEERKEYFAIVENTYYLSNHHLKSSKTIGRKYESEKSAHMAIGQFIKNYEFKHNDSWKYNHSTVTVDRIQEDGKEVWKAFVVETRFYDQKVSVTWKKDRKSLPREIIIPGSLHTWWTNDIFDYIKENYGADAVELHWGEIC